MVENNSTMIAQQQSQRQQLKILPQQIQLLNLYFLNSLELQQRIKNELEENPFLDVTDQKTEDDDAKLSKDTAQDFQDWEETVYDDKPDFRQEHQNYFDAEDAPNLPIINVTTFKEDAKHPWLVVSSPIVDGQLSQFFHTCT